MTRRLLLAVAAALVLPAVPAPAGAAPITIKKSMWGPIEVGGVSQFPVYDDLGVGLWQSTLAWDQVAPTEPADPRNPSDPAYRWPVEIDRAIAEGDGLGIRVGLQLIGTPPWANGGRDPRWAPGDPQDLAAFAEAASRRYPRVRHWMIWGEPTRATSFQPLEPDKGRPLRGAEALAGPRAYAGMLDAAFVALKRVTRANLVIGGNTFTVGTVAPLRWVRALRLPDGRRPRMDLWGHNPFSARPPRLDAPPLGSGYADFSDLDELARAIDRAFANGPRREQRRMRLFLSEFTVPTDHPSIEFAFHTSHRTQARWIGKALRIARGYRRIYTLGYNGLYDDPERPGGDQVERGLITRSGERKPAYAAFRDG